MAEKNIPEQIREVLESSIQARAVADVSLRLQLQLLSFLEKTDYQEQLGLAIEAVKNRAAELRAEAGL